MPDAMPSAYPCSGITVVELTTTMVSGPMCGQILADYGADVVRLEGLKPEMMRMIPPVRAGISASFAQFNRNKRSVALDLASDEGKEIAWSLLSRADVVIENARPGVLESQGYGYEAVRARNPRVIYVSVNGFGSDGPYAAYPAYDQVIQGLVGFMPIQGSGERPLAVKSVIVDKITALAAAGATLAALLQRGNDGHGQRVEVPMIDAFAAFILPELMANQAFSDDTTPAPGPADVYRPIATRDGYIVGLIAQDRQFAAICKVVGREDLLDDPRFASAPLRFRDMNALIDELETKTREFDRETLLGLLRETRDVAIAPVNSIEDFFQDPQARHNGTVYEIEDPETGPIRQVKPMANLFGSPPPQQRRAPKHGEQSREILTELGIGEERIASLLAAGRITSSK